MTVYSDYNYLDLEEPDEKFEKTEDDLIEEVDL